MEAYNIVLCIVSVCAVLELFFTGSVKRQSLPHPGRPNLSFNPKNMASMGIVEVAWSGVSEADLSRPVTERLCQQDAHCKEVKLSVWVGVFAKDGAKIKVPRTTGPQGYPAEPPWIDPSPIKWKPVNSTNGKVTFVLHHHRSELYFVLFSNGTSYPVPLVVSQDVLRFKDADEPNHFHIAKGKKQGSMVVMFEKATLIKGMTLVWGLSSSMISNVVIASASTFGRKDLKGSPARTTGFVQQPYFYRVELIGLPVGTTIYYKVGTGDTGYSRVRSFRTPKGVGPHTTLRALAFADMGVSYADGSQYHWEEPFAGHTLNGGLKVWEKVAGEGKGVEQFADLALLVGDLSYATGYASKWDYFMTAIEPLASKVPFMIGYGNHEQDCPNSSTYFASNDSGGECGLPTESRFTMPTSSQHDGWYSFEQGPVHFVMINTEMDASIGTRQYDFVLSDLKGVNRSVTPWVILAGHRPMYSSPYTGNFINLRAVWWKAIEDLVYQYRVDLCLYGHVHNAEVTCPMYRGKCLRRSSDRYPGPVHAIIGNSGQSLTPFRKTVPAWSEWRYKGFGFSTIEVNASKLTLSFYGDTNESAKLLHTVELIR